MVISKKRSLRRIKLRFIYFRGQLQVFSKKKGPHSESSSNLSIFVAKFSDLPITCAITIIFSKSSAALLGFLKFCDTKHKISICFLYCYRRHNRPILLTKNLAQLSMVSKENLPKRKLTRSGNLFWMHCKYTNME